MTSTAWEPTPTKIVTLDGLRTVLNRHRADGARVALTNGAFDLFHVGHVRSLRQRAKDLSGLVQLAFLDEFGAAHAFVVGIERLLRAVGHAVTIGGTAGAP